MDQIFIPLLALIFLLGILVGIVLTMSLKIYALLLDIRSELRSLDSSNELAEMNETLHDIKYNRK